MSVVMKVIGYDEADDNLIIKSVEPEDVANIDDAIEYAYTTHQYGGATPIDKLPNMAASAQAQIELDKTRSASYNNTPEEIQAYRDMIGQMYTYTEADMAAALNPNLLADQAADEAWVTVCNEMPIADENSLNRVRAMIFKYLALDVIRRPVDGRIVGIQIVSIFGSGSAPLNELNVFDAAMKEEGLPSMQKLVGDENMTKDEFATYNENTFGMITITGGSYNYSYSPATVAMYAKRQCRIIETERDNIIFAGVAYSGTTFQSRQRDIDLIKGKIASIAAGTPLPVDYVWRDMFNVNHPADEAFMIGLSDALDVLAETQYQNSWVRKAGVDAVVADSGLTDEQKITDIQAQ